MPPAQPTRQHAAHSAPSAMPYHPGHRRSVTAPSVPVSSASGASGASAASLSPAPVTLQRNPFPVQQQQPPQTAYHPPPGQQAIRPVLQPAPPARSPVPPPAGAHAHPHPHPHQHPHPHPHHHPHPGPHPGPMQQPVAGPQPPGPGPGPGPRGPPPPPPEAQHQEPAYPLHWPGRMPYVHRFFPAGPIRTIPPVNNDGYNFLLVCHAAREHGRPNSPMSEHVGFLLRLEVMTSLSPFIDSLTKDMPPGEVCLWLDETEANVAALLEVCNLLPDKPPHAPPLHPTARQYMGAGALATKYNFAALVPSIQYHMLRAPPPRDAPWQFDEIAFFLNFAHTTRSPALWDLCIRYLAAWRSQLDPRRLPRHRALELDPKVLRVLLTAAACTRGRALFDGVEGLKVKYSGDEPYVVVEPE